MSNIETSLEKQTMRKVTMRIIPFTFILYVISYIDKANISYAALQMNKELALSSEVFGIVSGIYFIGYFLFEVPSNVLMQRFGVKLWTARIMITWGIFSSLTAFAQNAAEMYVLRFLLGVAEAGFFPGILLYFTYWFRSKERATTNSLFQLAIPVSFIISAPLSTWIMSNMNHLMGLSGWKWMFLLEGVPSIILGIVTIFYLTERPEDAKWLSREEKDWLIKAMKEDFTPKKVKSLKTMKAITDPKVLYLSFIYFLSMVGSLGVGYWMPQIIKGFSSKLTLFQIGLISMIPYIVAAIVMVFWSRSSDRNHERKMHTAIPCLVSALGLLGAGFSHNPYLAITFITIALAAMYSFKGPFFSLPTLFLSQSSSGIAVSAINSIGNLGGFVGPYVLGLLVSNTGGNKAGLYFLSALLFLSFILILFMKLGSREAVQRVENENITVQVK
jgi:ACS family tartrate transporter-like MFS transporter